MSSSRCLHSADRTRPNALPQGTQATRIGRGRQTHVWQAKRRERTRRQGQAPPCTCTLLGERIRARGCPSIALRTSPRLLACDPSKRVGLVGNLLALRSSPLQRPSGRAVDRILAAALSIFNDVTRVGRPLAPLACSTTRHAIEPLPKEPMPSAPQLPPVCHLVWHFLARIPCSCHLALHIAGTHLAAWRRRACDSPPLRDPAAAVQPADRVAPLRARWTEGQASSGACCMCMGKYCR